MPRRILLLTTDLEIGGTPTVVRELALRLHHPPKVVVEVMCLGSPGPSGGPLGQAGVAVRALGASGIADLPRVVREVVRSARRFDTVFSFLVHANLVAAIASRFCCDDVRFIQSIHTTQPEPRWHWMVQRFAQECADTIVVPSPSAAKAARDWASVRKSKIIIIPNAVDAPRAAMPLQRHGPSFRVGFLGRLDPVKRVPDLLHAMSVLDDRFVLDVFGDGEERARIEAEIERLHIHRRVTLHGVTSQPQAAIAQMDILVLPSEAEGFGLVLIEAMAAGVPVVATNVPGVRDVVEHGKTGLLVPVASPNALARAIERIATDEPLRARLIDQARREVAERYAWDRVLTMYRSLLRLDHQSPRGNQSSSS